MTQNFGSCGAYRVDPLGDYSRGTFVFESLGRLQGIVFGGVCTRPTEWVFWVVWVT